MEPWRRHPRDGIVSAAMPEQLPENNLSSWPIDGFAEILFDSLKGAGLTQGRAWDDLSPAEISAYDDAADAFIVAYRDRREMATGGWADIDVTTTMMDAGFAAIRPCYDRHEGRFRISRMDMGTVYRAMAAEKGRAEAIAQRAVQPERRTVTLPK